MSPMGRESAAPLLEVRDLRVEYDVRKLFRKTGTIRAVDGVSFEVEAGETLAVVGESGCGKSSLAKCLLGIERPAGGTIRIGGVAPEAMTDADRRRSLQMIFQDPYGSLNPRKRAWQIVAEPLAINTPLSADERRSRAIDMMRKVGLRPELGDRYPHMFSGGQRQRLGIARALMLHPKLLVCDEPVSALDVSIQAQILNLLMDLQDELGLAYLFISHDLSVVRHVADRVLVIYLGQAVEYGPRDAIFSAPRHPYTRSLLASAPGKRKGERLAGELPSPMSPPPGCRFHRRCPHATDDCATHEPRGRDVDGRRVACHRAEELG